MYFCECPNCWLYVPEEEFETLQVARAERLRNDPNRAFSIVIAGHIGKTSTVRAATATLALEQRNVTQTRAHPTRRVI